MKKIKLVYIKGAEIGTRKNQSYPLGLMTMKRYVLEEKHILENVKIDIEVLDYDIQDEAFVFKIYQDKYDMILFSGYIWNLSRNLEMCRKIKLVCKDVIVGLGGPEVDNATQLLSENEYVNLIMIGEGEITFKKVINYFLLKDLREELKGVVYYQNNELIHTGKAEEVENLDDIPSILDDELMKNSRMLLYETSRGCPFQCKYCCWANKKMRYYSIERVENDLKKLFSLPYGDQVFIIDSEIDIDIERAKQILRLIIKYNVQKKIVQGFLGLHKIDEELLSLCKEARFKFGIGIQTVSESGLKGCGRTWFKPDEFKKKKSILQKYYDFKDIEFQLIMGLPGDNYETFKDNLKWCEDMGAKYITANRLYVLPGSYFNKHKDEYGIVYDNKPYHLIYSTNTYSYADIMKSESFLVAYQLTRGILEKEKYVSGLDTLDVWGFMESLAEIIMQKDMYSQGRQESQINEISYDFCEIMLENIKKMGISNRAFSNYILMKFTQKKANIWFRDNMSRLKEGIKEKGEVINIINYFIAPYTRLKNDTIIDCEGKSIIYLIDYSILKIKHIVIVNSKRDEVKKILDNLVIGYNINNLENRVEKDSFCYLFIKKMIDNNMIYWS